MHRRHALSLLASGPAAALALPAWAQSDRRLVLGQSCALSGPAAQLGLQMNRGARIYFDRLNAQGGVNGRTIELKSLDDGYEPDRCKANTETLIRDDVFALFGYVGTPTSLAALPLVNAARIPFIGPFTGAEALREPFSRYVFHVRASYYDETALIVKQLTSLGLTRIAVFRQNDSYGQAGLDGVVRALKAQKLEPAAIGLVERNSVDVAAAVGAIVAKQPHAVVQIGAYKGCAAFIRAARKAGYGGTFYNVSFVGTQALADELGKDGLGVVVSQVMPFPFSTTTPIAREYREAVQQAGGDATANYSSMEGYMAAKIFTEGLRRAGSATRDGLIAGLETLQRFDAGGYQVSYSARDHQGSSFVDLSMLTGDGKVRR
ncbi:ABC transporter substrate-binding protein [Rubrivivax sp. RP6-9]|uniref:ABC transporter substrate-binding protein n=1 Tax=Rubrivivax sp. RP6-9 TaxID=3415750 RepID=UPI003CC612F8